MFELDLPWWEFILRGTIIYGTLLVLVRASGRRTVGQFTPFDLVVVLLISEGASAALSGGDNSVGGAMLIVSTLIGLNLLVAWATSRSRRLEALFEGEALLVGRDGRFFDALLRRHRVSDEDVKRSLREADCELAEMQYAFLEIDGTLSIQKRKNE